MGMYSGSAPLKPSIIARSVACPIPVNDREPYKSTEIPVILSKMFRSFNSAIKRSAALHGPNVCELDGPTPIFNISKTEMHSIMIQTFNKAKLRNYYDF